MSEYIYRYDTRVSTEDGIELAATIFESSEVVQRKVAIIACGVGLLKSRYADYATHLANNGWTVITFDYRGIGESELKRELHNDSRLRDWGNYDLAACIEWAGSLDGTQRIVVIGHSVGGQIFAFAPNNRKVDTLIAVCAQKGYWRFWEGSRRVGLFGLWYALPVFVGLFGYLPLQLFGRGSNVPAGIAREWGRWGRTREFVDEHGNSLNSVFTKVSSRVLAISFTDDKFYAPLQAVVALISKFNNTDVTHWHLQPEAVDCEVVGHSGFFRNQSGVGMRRLWEQVDAWMENSNYTNAANVQYSKLQQTAEATHVAYSSPYNAFEEYDQ